ncbi:topoisomerase IV [Providencia rustigianii]|uniref:topoisomerase IV n=1 Tax=Providencia rustigianii TaxID=158850 RepID=UPI00223F8ED6|nr:topoisomerase IV [Providencia rustigianii]
MNTNSPRKTALVISIIFIGFALGFYWLSKDNNVLSTESNSAIHSEAIAQVEKELPILVTIKKISPVTYQNFESLMSQYDPANEELRRQLLDLIISQSMKLVVERMPYASDETVVNFTAKVNDNLKALLAEDPTGKVCFNALFPQLRDSADIIPPQKSQNVLLKQISAINALLISGEAGVKQPVLSKAEYQQILSDLRTHLVTKYGNDVSILTNLEAGKKSPATVCQISISLYDEALGIPDNAKKAALLRTWFSSANN